jgi:hypothetical protein
MASWLNSDGLYIKLGQTEGVASDVGEYVTTGPLRMIEWTLQAATSLTASYAVQEPTTVVPKGARIEKVEVEVLTACTSGGSATLDVGLYRVDQTTELDGDGFVAAAALATINTAGKLLTLINGATGAGALVGTTLANNGVFVARYNTAAFTAGKLAVRVWYSFPT